MQKPLARVSNYDARLSAPSVARGGRRQETSIRSPQWHGRNADASGLPCGRESVPSKIDFQWLTSLHRNAYGNGLNWPSRFLRARKSRAFFNETAKEVLMGLARNPHLQERDLLRLLERKDLAHEVVHELAHHKAVRRSYAVQLALVRHPKTPRQVSLPLMKFLYIFDLLRVAQTPAVPADVKMVAEETILKKLVALPRGQKTSLARRGTGRLAASLLGEP